MLPMVPGTSELVTMRRVATVLLESTARMACTTGKPFRSAIQLSQSASPEALNSSNVFQKHPIFAFFIIFLNLLGQDWESSLRPSTWPCEWSKRHTLQSHSAHDSKTGLPSYDGILSGHMFYIYMLYTVPSCSHE